MDNFFSIKSRKEMQYYIYIIPAILIYFVFFLFPVLTSFYYSVFEFAGPGQPKDFIWFNNFIELFTNDPIFITAIRNNVVFTLFVLVFQTLLSFILALILSNKLKGGNAFKTFFFTPVVLSSVAISFLWNFMYDPNVGALNLIFETVGLAFLKNNWLGDMSIAIYSIAFVQIWQFVGFQSIIFIAGLNNIPNEMYEAANIEGVNGLQKLRYITIPLLAPATTIAIVLTTTGCFKMFDKVYIMTGGGPANATEVLATMIYSYAFSYNRMGFASAISVVLLSLIMIIGFSQLIFLRKKEIEQ